MKYGAHCYIFTDHWSDASLPLLEHAKTLGLDCLEIALGDDVEFTLAATRRTADDVEMHLIVSPGALWPVEMDLSAEDVEQRQAGLVWHQKQIDIAVELGAVAYCGALYGHPGVIRRGRRDPQEYVRTAEQLHRLAEYGQQRGVKIALEPMSHFRTHVVNTPSQVMELIHLADHPNLFVLLDTYHMVAEVRDYGEAVDIVAERLWGVHACENDRGCPGGGLIPWDSFCRGLMRCKFDGYVLLEAYNSSIGDFARERGMFHNVCPDTDQFITEGLRFLKQTFEQVNIRR